MMRGWQIALAASLLAMPANAQDKPYRHDSNTRLVSYDGKEQLACPKQDKDTAVLLMFGQSNHANHGAFYHQTIYPDRSINYFNGKCYQAGSPLLGASGFDGEVGTLIADQLIEKGIYKKVIIINTAIGGTRINLWAPNGIFNNLLHKVIKDAKPDYTITHLLWHQGESDFEDATPPEEYRKHFNAMVDSLRTAGIKAPLFYSVTTKGCLYEPIKRQWFPDNEIALMQASFADKKRRIFLAANTDKILGQPERANDGCHFSLAGGQKYAKAIAAALARHKR